MLLVELVSILPLLMHLDHLQLWFIGAKEPELTQSAGLRGQYQRYTLYILRKVLAEEISRRGTFICSTPPTAAPGLHISLSRYLKGSYHQGDQLVETKEG